MIKDIKAIPEAYRHKQPADKGLDETTCSASSDTPETDAKREAMIYLRPDGEYRIDALADFARKLERQRNAAWKTLKEIRELFTADESFGATVEALFATPLGEAEAEIARLQSLLNADVLARGRERHSEAHKTQ